MKTLLISAFPGTGKTYAHENLKFLSSLDSDSSKFDKKEFPSNYIEHIKKNLGNVDVIFISSHKEVRDALVENDLKFVLIYPDISLKDEYIERYIKRGSSEGFIKLIDDNWNMWISELQNQENCEHVILKTNEYLIGPK